MNKIAAIAALVVAVAFGMTYPAGASTEPNPTAPPTTVECIPIRGTARDACSMPGSTYDPSAVSVPVTTTYPGPEPTAAPITVPLAVAATLPETR